MSFLHNRNTLADCALHQAPGYSILPNLTDMLSQQHFLCCNLLEKLGVYISLGLVRSYKNIASTATTYKVQHLVIDIHRCGAICFIRQRFLGKN